MPIQTFPELIICGLCDSVYKEPELAGNESAYCTRCGAPLYRRGHLNLDQWLALTIAAAVVFVLANVYPVVSVTVQGSHNETTLWQSAFALAHGPAAPMALVAAFAVIIIPMLQIALLAWVVGFARTGRRAPAFAAAMKTLQALHPWSMVEVCLLGALIAIIKLSSYMDVVAGVGIWAMAALTILITIISSRDIHGLWHFGAEQRR